MRNRSRRPSSQRPLVFGIHRWSQGFRDSADDCPCVVLATHDVAECFFFFLKKKIMTTLQLNAMYALFMSSHCEAAFFTLLLAVLGGDSKTLVVILLPRSHFGVLHQRQVPSNTVTSEAIVAHIALELALVTPQFWCLPRTHTRQMDYIRSLPFLRSSVTGVPQLQKVPVQELFNLTHLAASQSPGAPI